MQPSYTITINGIKSESFEECMKYNGAYSGIINLRKDCAPINCIYLDDYGNFVAIK